jgi:hypothetical protein
MLSDALETSSLPLTSESSLQELLRVPTFLCYARSKARVYRVVRLRATLSDALETSSLLPTSESSLQELLRVPTFPCYARSKARVY